MREATQYRIILELLNSYHGKEPLSRYLKKYFHRNRQLGSRDRRLIQQFMFNYFRIGKMYAEKTMEERLAIANHICRTEAGPLLDYSSREIQRIERLTAHLEPDKIFPFGRHLSDSIGKAEYIHSFIVQPKAWIRVREEFAAAVEKEFSEKKIEFEKDPEVPLAWSVRNSTPLDQLDSYLLGYFEIQDLSSQKTIGLIQPKAGETWWDACAGSGGKSLMMAASEPSINMFCTDARAGILKNLTERFRRSGIKNYTAKMMDLSAGGKPRISIRFDGILADVPCTGSGTWARTPERLAFFDTGSIAKFQDVQRKIISGIAGLLPENKPFVYITCSVFKEENEDMTSWVAANSPLKLQTQKYFEGAAKGADTMFVARFIRS